MGSPWECPHLLPLTSVCAAPLPGPRFLYLLFEQINKKLFNNVKGWLIKQETQFLWRLKGKLADCNYNRDISRKRICHRWVTFPRFSLRALYWQDSGNSVFRVTLTDWLFWMFVFPKIHMLKTDPQCDGIWRWGLWGLVRALGGSPMNRISALITETEESSLAPSAMWGHSEKTDSRLGARKADPPQTVNLPALGSDLKLPRLQNCEK